MTLLDERPSLAPDVAAEPAPPSLAKSAAPTPPENAPTGPAKGEADRAAEKLLMLRRARKSAVAVTVFIACGSFGLSFYSLWDMASQLAWPWYIAWLWPLIVDGMIIVATMSLVAFGGYTGQKANVVYSWCVLGFGAVVSMGANFVHPLLPHLMGQAQGPVSAGLWLGAGMSCIPPIALLACTHLLARLWAFSPEDEEFAMAVAVADTVGVSSASGVAELSRAVAARIQAGGKLTSYPEDDVAEIVRLLFQSEPPLKLREIGRMVDRHHDVVGRVRDEVSALLGVGMAAEAAG
ncbi:DUF2637 domain-containing protein [Mycolicibacterium wolinskyi]|uniref:Phage excisionase n=1 Tax=Mycolicibacterium wolinskyi TaxID=59750 RepID=A0A1X2FC18_9MYCO|nr:MULTISPECIES: DUF2637 domain-containing protein [Mycolicibacterium]MCV7289148.1 DUF2637 domain-containing protein [Mycolicibacterium wolinskyi]MCV7297309.1 DUF2637 domain-containing protein [Mycolicibacterium goodii]ORX15982.1 hypothetical protein AWC31_01015 [Mycolicibacterium wolinskyi]